ncbi:MAG: hypothetical protein AAF361_07800, partial [Bacteroidota bacterium]
KGKWRTVERFWNSKGVAYFKVPEGARIKVRYGIKWFGKDRQKQTLDGVNNKVLSVGWGSLAFARMQVKVSESQIITYEVFPGGLAAKSPKIRFE